MTTMTIPVTLEREYEIGSRGMTYACVEFQFPVKRLRLYVPDDYTVAQILDSVAAEVKDELSAVGVNFEFVLVLGGTA